MRKKIAVVCVCLFLTLITIIILSVWNYDSQMREYYSNYYQNLKIEKKYHGACRVCTSYIAKNGYGSADSVRVRELFYQDIKENIDIIRDDYVDEKAIWEFAFLLEGYEEDSLILYYDPEENVICAVVDERYIESTEYQFAYEIDKLKYIRGEQVIIKVSLTNISGGEHHYSGKYSDYNAKVKLYFQDKEGIHIMQCSPTSYREDNTEVGEFSVKNMEARTRTYYYMLPTYARLGKYHLELSYDEDAVLYKDVFEVCE